ncbi:hypothetical protein VST7929_02614 [Vibrio stylophorae]|uniref:HTH tetR-type domain-containing protein n=1 Tax=Vibrio stylophorae TaxID=659351 RepID=A0ABN8DWH5_9VIBR|nr:TetR/AcrR family transcriptional regulator [Vibrio stylophorae]CAH0534664.1 hypothetical protein VST7929_02614 [Vibrio stylophorae]
MSTKQRILDAALQLMNARGERAITTNHIAAELNMSPGNLYYHFRNKEQILAAILRQYSDDLLSHFSPQDSQASTVAHMSDYFDALFMLMWRYRFFYANLPDILSRNEQMQQDYAQTQRTLSTQITALVESARAEGLIELRNDDVDDFVATLKIVASSWISYHSAQCGGSIDKAVISAGVKHQLGVIRPIATDAGRRYIAQLEQKYRDQDQ